MFFFTLQRARCCFCFGDDTGKESQIILLHYCIFFPPILSPPALSSLFSVYAYVPSGSVCIQRSYAHCYSSARLRMVKKYWSANTDDVTVTRRLVWHSEAGQAGKWDYRQACTAPCWKYNTIKCQKYNQNIRDISPLLQYMFCSA